MASKYFNQVAIPAYTDEEKTVPSYTADEWHDIYQYSNAGTNISKAIILSILARNTAEPGADSSIEVEIDITDTTNKTQYSIGKCLLSAQDEFRINRYKQLFVMEVGWKIRARYEKAGIDTYVSILENV